MGESREWKREHMFEQNGRKVLSVGLRKVHLCRSLTITSSCFSKCGRRAVLENVGRGYLGRESVHQWTIDNSPVCSISRCWFDSSKPGS